jgi:hypothetical protein
MLTVRPAIVSEALRCDVPGFAAAVNETVPLPLPLVPLVIVIHEADEVADHPHPTGAVTENVLDAADDPMERLVGLTE